MIGILLAVFTLLTVPILAMRGVQIWSVTKCEKA
jgi:hypothetical protein